MKRAGETFDRPRLELERSRAEWTFEAIAALGVVLLVVATAWMWPTLPDRIPMHFDFSGHVDRYGGRLELLFLPAIAVVLYVGLTFLARVPHVFNFPVRLNADNVARQYRLGRMLVTGLKAAIVWTFLVILVEIGRVAGEPGAAPSPFVIAVPIVAIFGGIAVYFVAAARAR